MRRKVPLSSFGTVPATTFRSVWKSSFSTGASSACFKNSVSVRWNHCKDLMCLHVSQKGRDSFMTGQGAPAGGSAFCCVVLQHTPLTRHPDHTSTTLYAYELLSSALCLMCLLTVRSHCPDRIPSDSLGVHRSPQNLMTPHSTQLCKSK